MPVINGRFHLPQQRLTPRQLWAYGAGVVAAVVIVAAGWWTIAGRAALSAFIAGVGQGVGSVAQTAGTMRGEAADAAAPGVEAARAAVTDILKDAQAKKAAADIVADQLKPVPPAPSL